MYLNSNNNNWLKAKVIQGRKLGRKLGFPTINLDNVNLLKGKEEGVYACITKINQRIYQGILYYGPRLVLGERENILEIYLFDFDKDIYGENVEFQLIQYLRKAKNFPSLEELKRQMDQDSSLAKDILLKYT